MPKGNEKQKEYLKPKGKSLILYEKEKKEVLSAEGSIEKIDDEIKGLEKKIKKLKSKRKEIIQNAIPNIYINEGYRFFYEDKYTFFLKEELLEPCYRKRCFKKNSKKETKEIDESIVYNTYKTSLKFAKDN